MPHFGKSSKSSLDTCHPILQDVLNKAIKLIDFSVLEGIRSDERQNEMFNTGRSSLKAGEGMHNFGKTHPQFKPDPSNVSLAVDIMPWPQNINDISVWEKSESNRFIQLCCLILGIAYEMGVILRWGGDWKGDFIFNESFIDYPHLELKNITSKSIIEKYGIKNT